MEFIPRLESATPGDFIAHFIDHFNRSLQNAPSIALTSRSGQIEEQALAGSAELANQRVLLAPTAGPGAGLGAEGERLAIDLKVFVGETWVQCDCDKVFDKCGLKLRVSGFPEPLPSRRHMIGAIRPRVSAQTVVRLTFPDPSAI